MIVDIHIINLTFTHSDNIWKIDAFDLLMIMINRGFFLSYYICWEYLVSPSFSVTSELGKVGLADIEAGNPPLTNSAQYRFVNDWLIVPFVGFINIK